MLRYASELSGQVFERLYGNKQNTTSCEKLKAFVDMTVLYKALLLVVIFPFCVNIRQKEETAKERNMLILLVGVST